MQNRCFLILLFFYLFFTQCFSQNTKIDSLRAVALDYKATVSNYEKDTVYIQHLAKLGYAFRFVKLDSMLAYATTSKRLSEAINYTNGILSANKEIGIYYTLKGDFEKAKEIHYNNLEASKKIGNYKTTIDTYSAIGYIYSRINDYPSAYKICLEAIDFASKHNDYENVTMISLNIGAIFALLNDFENSLYYFKECLKYQELHGLTRNRGMVYANMGYSYLHLKKYDKGLDYLNKALKVFEKSHELQWKAFSYLTIGQIYLKQHKLNEALNFLKKSEAVHTQIEDKKGDIDMKIAFANTYLLLQEKTLALAYSEKAALLAKDNGYLKGMLGSSEILYKLSKKEGEWENALMHLEHIRKISDSIATEKNRNTLLIDEAKFNYQKEKENIKVAAEKKILRQKQYFILSLIGLGIAILAAILIYRSNKRSRNLNIKLAKQTETLSKSQSNLNLINSNQEKLFSIVGHDLRGPIVSLKELVGLSLENSSGEGYFKRFAPKLKKDLDHIHFMLDNLLNWGQTQMRGATLNAENIDIKDEIDEILRLFQNNKKEKNITINNHVKNETKTFADLNHFIIIVRNIISNAIKFTRENGTIAINSIENNKEISITIVDNGIGMSTEVLDKLFNNSKYYSTFGTNNERGTGIGLLLCKEMIEKNNGSIKVESAVGKGSKFIINLPKAT